MVLRVVLRFAEHILALPVAGLIITTPALQYSNISFMQYAICQFFQFCYYLERHSPVRCLVGRPHQTGKTYPFQSPAGHD